MQIEGMVCKRKHSVYAHARSKQWLKVKTSAGRTTMQKRIETWGK
jgi:ATP-dependent DNA ligase